MPKKPTQPFGHIAFPKSGPARKEMTLLPDNKEGQEVEIAMKFVEHLHRLGFDFEPQKLPENDNDFILKSAQAGSEVVLELAELVGREYLVEANGEYRNNPNPRFSEWVYMRPERIFGVDRSAKDQALKKLIVKKIEKSYSRPKSKRFWLLIWTTQSDYNLEWWQGGARCSSNALMEARKHLEDNGAGPFDIVWAFFPEVTPCKIWPLEG